MRVIDLDSSHEELYFACLKDWDQSEEAAVSRAAKKAWYEKMRDRERALVLAKKAVAQRRSPEFLDTLAEAYYANGFTAEAISNIQEAIFIARENRGYLERQLAKFQGAR